MKVCPSQRIKQYEDEKAIPLNAREAIKGSPSPWQVVTIRLKHVIESVMRLKVSELFKDVVILVWRLGIYRREIGLMQR